MRKIFAVTQKNPTMVAMDTAIEMHWWIVPAAEVPLGEEARIDWLFAWWATIDDWIDQRQADAGLSAPR